ncbi:hypothetical protein [Dickeya dadantii]|uniref:hypothetical protein n=1 Tax=Dickeya dadantii TaxID=204038 RepID=UPI0014954F00|nr:hypothetical protein [Dickeya dadantii]NPE54099.1 hypothetical protein [Dickeya dadantii]NPE58531.1 hypothetical protein [Dickeya dadantii]NPE66776.1 hypothetical protein [Dickeya dadantii]NPE72707.1 hypothetical protein [Dickeya dadantii]UAY94565.1 hypothetical protein KTF62_11845 [Dickeya dadantii]
MIRFQKINFFLLIFLIGYWSLVISITIFLARFGVAMLFFLTSSNPLYFDWFVECISAVKKGVSAGAILGMGIWIKARLEKKKSKESDN